MNRDCGQHLKGFTFHLYKSLAATKTPHSQTALQRQIAATDNQIDILVYELYAMTPDEIALVESNIHPMEPCDE